MSLYKRNGTYWYDFTIDGNRMRKSTKQTDRYLAGLVMNDEISKARTQGVDAVVRKSPVLSEFSVQFLQWVEDAHSIEPETRRYYRNGWRLLKETKLAEKRMDKIANHDCETITFPGGNSNANTALRTLRRMFAKAKELKQFFGDLPEIGLRKEWGRSIAMSIADASSIAAKMEEGNARDAFLVIRGTGMRPKECFGLRWENFRWDALYYQNPNGKTKASRRAIPLLGESAVVLNRRHIAHGSPVEGWVFPAGSQTGHMMSIHKAFTRARKAAGLPSAMVLYTARHGAGTDLANVTSLKETMDILGHGDTQTAMRYQHPSTSNLKEKLEAAQVTGRVQ